MFVRDLAPALMRHGWRPVIYSPKLGPAAEDLRDLTIPVIDDLRDLSAPPDIIHAQHHHEAATAILRFPQTPAILVCHGWAPWPETPVSFPTIMTYVAVDQLCRERLITSPGVDGSRIRVIYNSVNMERFEKVRRLPERPKRALVYSNYSSKVPEAVERACKRAGIEEIDIAGLGARQSWPDPENRLSGYDIVFAKARCAMEALASGCAVVVTDRAGLAGMVTTNNLATLRQFNFGARTMKASLATEARLYEEIERYDPAEAARVTEWVRENLRLDLAQAEWLDTYEQAMDRWKGAAVSQGDVLSAGADYLRFVSLRVKEANDVRKRAESAEAERDGALAELRKVREEFARLRENDSQGACN